MEALGFAGGTVEPAAQFWLRVSLAHHTGSARGSLLGHRNAVLAGQVGEVAMAMAQVQLPQQVHVSALGNLVKSRPTNFGTLALEMRHLHFFRVKSSVSPVSTVSTGWNL